VAINLHKWNFVVQISAIYFAKVYLFTCVTPNTYSAPLRDTPRAFSILDITALLGIALPDSYSFTTVVFSLILRARSFWVSPALVRACWILTESLRSTFFTAKFSVTFGNNYHEIQFLLRLLVLIWRHLLWTIEYSWQQKLKNISQFPVGFGYIFSRFQLGQ
jgi:hypothetical protein